MEKIIEGKVVGDYQVKPTGIQEKAAFNVWIAMLYRCYSKKSLKVNPSYRGCKVSKDFRVFENFYEWCILQDNFNKPNFELDKDLLSKGNNKLYSAETCLFIPRLINKSISGIFSSKMTGICFDKFGHCFYTTISYGGVTFKFGPYTTQKEARLKYCELKKATLVCLAEKYKDVLSELAYNTLVNFKLNPDTRRTSLPENVEDCSHLFVTNQQRIDEYAVQFENYAIMDDKVIT